MQYDGRFRFKSIEPRRFYDTPSVIFILGIAAVVCVQMLLIASGKPGLRAFLGL